MLSVAAMLLVGLDEGNCILYLIKRNTDVTVVQYFQEVMAMNEADKNEKLDSDILECKEDILRASDIIPPYNTDKKGQIQEKAVKKEAEAVKADEAKPLEIKEIGQGRTEIPRFDLAEEIMAEHRKITAIKRKSPEKKMEAEARPAVRPFRYAFGPQRLTVSGQEDVIAEIVARDIKRLCGEN